MAAVLAHNIHEKLHIRRSQHYLAARNHTRIIIGIFLLRVVTGGMDNPDISDYPILSATSNFIDKKSVFS